MENETFTDSNFNGGSQRPIFLLVLCVLSALAIISNVFSTISAIMDSTDVTIQIETAMEQIEDTEGIPESVLEDFKQYTITTINNFKAINTVTLLLYLLEGLAVLMMFNLKKMGYWIYLASQVGFILTIFLFYPSNNFITSILIGYYFVASGLFAILYGANLKYLK